jgi:hypothetical protein
MKIAIKYPRKKFIEANNILDLQKELSILMIEKFDIKNSDIKPFTDKKLDIETRNISESDFEILQKENSVIVPSVITQCEI